MADQSTPVKGAAYDLYFTLYKNDGTVIANPGTYTKKISKDGGTVGDCSNSVTEIDTTYGLCKLTLSAAEMTADAVWVQIKDDTTGCVPLSITMYPAASDVIANMVLALKLLRNKVITDPSTGVMTIYDDDNATPLYTANVYQDAAGATQFTGTGANRRNRLA